MVILETAIGFVEEVHKYEIYNISEIHRYVQVLSVYINIKTLVHVLHVCIGIVTGIG